MLNNLSYKDLKIEKEINTLIGKEYSFLEKLIRRGIGSKKLIIKKADNIIYDKLSKSYDLNECNIEIRSKGIIIYFKSKLLTYGLSIPYYKLIIFKVDTSHYTINYDKYFLKLRVKDQSDHKFFKKISKYKSNFLKDTMA
mgnify:FL=1